MIASPEPGLRKKLLVTGASGFLGWHLCQWAQTDWEVHGTYCYHPIEIDGVHLHAIDLTQRHLVEPWILEVAPAAVIHTAALSQPNRCEQEPARSYAINVEATQHLAAICRDRQIPLVFTSTDQVFDGQSAPYTEDDWPNPLNCYGRHKVEAEQWIRQLHPTASLCRLPLMYGPPSPQAECFLQGFLRTLRAGQPLPLFVDEFRTPAYVDDVVAGLLLALHHGAPLLHLGGPERLSRYEFGLQMAEVFDLDAALIVPSHQADVPMAAPRPADVSTQSQRAYDLGYRPRGVRAGLQAVKATTENGLKMRIPRRSIGQV